MAFKVGDRVQFKDNKVRGTIQEIRLGVPENRYWVKWDDMFGNGMTNTADITKVEDDDK